MCVCVGQSGSFVSLEVEVGAVMNLKQACSSCCCVSHTVLLLFMNKLLFPLPLSAVWDLLLAVVLSRPTRLSSPAAAVLVGTSEWFFNVRAEPRPNV